MGARVGGASGSLVGLRGFLLGFLVDLVGLADGIFLHNTAARDLR